MPDETQTPKPPPVKTWKTVKKELEQATARVTALTIKLVEAQNEQSAAKLAADAMAAKITAELNGKPTH